MPVVGEIREQLAASLVDTVAMIRPAVPLLAVDATGPQLRGEDHAARYPTTARNAADVLCHWRRQDWVNPGLRAIMRKHVHYRNAP